MGFSKLRADGKSNVDQSLKKYRLHHHAFFFFFFHLLRDALQNLQAGRLKLIAQKKPAMQAFFMA